LWVETSLPESAETQGDLLAEEGEVLRDRCVGQTFEAGYDTAGIKESAGCVDMNRLLRVEESGYFLRALPEPPPFKPHNRDDVGNEFYSKTNAELEGQGRRCDRSLPEAAQCRHRPTA
jgi:hypothetical protein